MIREDTYIALCRRHDGSSMLWLFLRRLAIAGCRLHVMEASSEGKAYEKNCQSVDSLQVHVRDTDGVGLIAGWRIAGLRREGHTQPVRVRLRLRASNVCPKNHHGGQL
jgi:hypothetical protein